jgi:hypothetical protein
LFINWIEPIDPTPLRYKLTFFDESGEETSANVVEGNFYSKRVNSSGHFTIKAIDSAGNHSLPSERQRFIFTPVNRDVFYIIPNPIRAVNREFTMIYYLIEASDFVNISIFNISGQLVWESQKPRHEAGEHSLRVSISLSTGIYFALLHTDNSVLRERFAVVR